MNEWISKIVFHFVHCDICNVIRFAAVDLLA